MILERQLEDTFLGFLVHGWIKTVKRKAINRAKAEIQHLPVQSDLYGQASEHFIALELRAYLSYRRLHLPLNYWCSKHGHEVDFIVGNKIAIEVKATNKVQEKHAKNLKILADENLCERYILISKGKVNRTYGNIEFIY